MVMANLNRQQGFALISEMTSTRNLLAYGIRAVRTGAFVETARDPILTMLSIGVEKLYKLTLGLISLDRDGAWPAQEQMRTRGHNLDSMHAAVIHELRARTADKTDYVRNLLAAVEEDPIVPPLIAMLGRYGQSGRFYYLDLLGDAPQQWDSPTEYWQLVEDVVVREPDVAAAFEAASNAVSNNDLWDHLHRTIHERIALALERLWEMIAICGRNHALGQTGSTFGVEIHPNAVGHQ